MTPEEIRYRITSRTGAETRGRFTQRGSEVGVRVPDGTWLVGLVPINDESRTSFIDFMVKKYADAALSSRKATK